MVPDFSIDRGTQKPPNMRPGGLLGTESRSLGLAAAQHADTAHLVAAYHRLRSSEDGGDRLVVADGDADAREDLREDGPGADELVAAREAYQPSE